MILHYHIKNHFCKTEVIDCNFNLFIIDYLYKLINNNKD